MQKCAVVQFDFTNSFLLQQTKNLLESKFNFEATLRQLNSMPLNEIFDSSRNQYYSTKILEHALKHFSGEYEKIIVLTRHDLFVPVLTFVFGEAQLDGKAAIISSARLHNEFYGIPPDENILRRRFKKEALHEIGHTFGLRHCKDWFCVMHSSSSIDEVDVKGEEFCKDCMNRIRE